MYTIGVDLGGTLIRCGLFRANGEIIHKEDTPTLAQEGPDAVIDRIKQSIAHTLSQLPPTQAGAKNIKGIGIGSPGPLNPYTGHILSPANLPGWHNIPLKDIIQKEFSIPVHVNNDANAAALAELYYGEGQPYNHFIYVTISTGIGGGVVVDRQLLLGKDGNAAEIGHMIIDPHGPQCGCGNDGCFEAFASGTAIAKRAQDLLCEDQQLSKTSTLASLSSITSKDVFDAAQANDTLAIQIVQETQFYLGIGLSNLINLYNPAAIIIGGGVSKAGPAFFERAFDIARSKAQKAMRENITFLFTKPDGDVGLVGAAALVKHYGK